MTEWFLENLLGLLLLSALWLLFGRAVWFWSRFLLLVVPVLGWISLWLLWCLLLIARPDFWLETCSSFL